MYRKWLVTNNNCGVYKSFIRDLVAQEDTQFDLISSGIKAKLKFQVFLQGALFWCPLRPADALHISQFYSRQTCKISNLLRSDNFNKRKQMDGMRNRSDIPFGNWGAEVTHNR